MHRILGRRGAQRDLPMRRRELERIVEQIRQHHLDARQVTHHRRWRGRRADAQDDLFVLRLHPERRGGRVEQIAHIVRGQIEFDQASIQP